MGAFSAGLLPFYKLNVKKNETRKITTATRLVLPTALFDQITECQQTDNNVILGNKKKRKVIRIL